MCLVMIPNTEADTGVSKSGGVGCHGYGYFTLKLFVAGQRCMDKTLADKMRVDKTPVKIAGEDKMQAILWDRKDKMPILSKHLLYLTDGQVSRKRL